MKTANTTRLVRATLLLARTVQQRQMAESRIADWTAADARTGCLSMPVDRRGLSLAWVAYTTCRELAESRRAREERLHRIIAEIA